jgi:putative membrane protein insertion efficiency factor
VKEVWNQIAVQGISLPIHVYRYAISPLLPASCRHIPTCSQYSLEALKMHGIITGTALAANRIIRCHPWGTQGYDPVPKFIFPIKYKSKLFETRLQ